jgi:hypothetical protein
VRSCARRPKVLRLLRGADSCRYMREEHLVGELRLSAGGASRPPSSSSPKACGTADARSSVPALAHHPRVLGAGLELRRQAVALRPSPALCTGFLLAGNRGDLPGASASRRSSGSRLQRGDAALGSEEQARPVSALGFAPSACARWRWSLRDLREHLAVARATRCCARRPATLHGDDLLLTDSRRFPGPSA